MMHHAPLTRALPTSLLLLLAGAAACGDGPTGPKGVAAFQLQLSATTLEVGEFLEMTLTNRGAGKGYFDFCKAAFQIREGSEWVTLRSVRLCLLRFTPLEPGQSATAPMLLERAGTLRVVVPVKESAAAVPGVLISAEITVAEP